MKFMYCLLVSVGLLARLTSDRGYCGQLWDSSVSSQVWDGAGRVSDDSMIFITEVSDGNAVRIWCVVDPSLSPAADDLCAGTEVSSLLPISVLSLSLSDANGSCDMGTMLSIPVAVFSLFVLGNEIGILLTSSELDIAVVCSDVVCSVDFNEIGIVLGFSELDLADVSRDVACSVVFNEDDIVLGFSELNMAVGFCDVVCSVVFNEVGIVLNMAVGFCDVVCSVAFKEVGIVLVYSENDIAVICSDVVCSVVFSDVGIVLGYFELVMTVVC